MQCLLDNPVTPTKYSMYSTAQCPKALAWMAALSAATGRNRDAQTWLVELISAVVFVREQTETHEQSPALQDTTDMS